MQRADAMACLGRQLHVRPCLEEQGEQLWLRVRACNVQRAQPVLADRVRVCMHLEQLASAQQVAHAHRLEELK